MLAILDPGMDIFMGTSIFFYGNVVLCEYIYPRSCFWRLRAMSAHRSLTDAGGCVHMGFFGAQTQSHVIFRPAANFSRLTLSPTAKGLCLP